MAATATNSLLPNDENNTDPAQSLLTDQTNNSVQRLQQPGGFETLTPTTSSAPSTGGLISGSMTTTPGPTPDTSSSSGTTPSTYTPTLGTVSDKETVAGHVNDLLSADNPIMQTARSQAAQAANSRGLLNSSMAVQAGEQAAINSALPIATQDAATFHDTSVRNQQAQNEAGQFNAGAANQLQLQGLRGDQATSLANIEANYKTVLQTSASASQLYSEIVKSVGAILDDPNTTADQKQNAVNKQIQLLQSGLAAIGGTGNVDLAGLLDFSAVNSPVTPPAAPPAQGAPGSPAPAGSQGAGHNIGDTFTDAQGNTFVVNQDGSLTQYGFA